MITYGTRNPRLVYNVTVYNHVDGQLSETYVTHKLAIARRNSLGIEYLID